MADRHTNEVRSYNMSRIRSKNTKPEIAVRKFLHAEGFRFRVHVKNLPGKPDIVLPKYKTIIQINGCFWHGHPSCKHASLPKTNEDWWAEKIQKNITRDIWNESALKSLGWRVITVWTCQLKTTQSQLTLHNLAVEIKRG